MTVTHSAFGLRLEREDAPPADGVHWAGCRIQLGEPTGRPGRVIRCLVTGDGRYPGQ
ncbi:hypothetical protein [Streptomyces sp. NPDC048248]|uniref:hypothetical protein n=1 Tax=Streptomyces sp. NPDC048248 TaxID=3365523 RepID=UPI00371F9852